MDALDRLNRAAGSVELDGATAEVLHWAYAPHLPDNRPHRHTYFEVCLVGSHGRGSFRVVGRSEPLAPGSLFAARPGIEHQITNGECPCMELSWVCFNLRPHASDGIRGPAKSFAESAHCVVHGAAAVTSAWRALHELAPEVGDAALRCLVSAVLLCIVDAFAPVNDALRTPGSSASRGGSAARLALLYIHDNLDRALQLAEVARHVGVSSRHLARLMRAHTALSFHDYVTRARLSLAAHLLRRSSLPVKAVGQRVGYPDVHHFTRTFSRGVGLPPAAYRRADSHVPVVQIPDTWVQRPPSVLQGSPGVEA